MAITASYLKRTEAVDVTANDGAATFSINLGDKPGKDVIIIAENTSATATMTATLEIVAGDYLASATGDNAITQASCGKRLLLNRPGTKNCR